MDEAQESGQAQPRVPRIWSPLLVPLVDLLRQRADAMSEIVTANRELEARVASRTKELEEANARLEEIATRDPLTGALNRRRLDEMLATERARVDRGGETFSLVAADLDHFKAVNDRHGHRGGDAVLREFVARVHRTARASDEVFRVGGEEFLILLPMTSASQAARFAERLRTAVAEAPVDFEGTPIDVRVSIGLTGYRLPESVDDVIERADAHLYRAKREGRDRIVGDADVGVDAGTS